MADTPAPVTVAITRHVKPGKVAEYDAWLHEMTLLASRWPGYHGSTVLRPRHGGDRPEYTTVLHFDTETNLRSWLDAPERQALLARVGDIADDPEDAVVFEPGMDYWFTPQDGPPLLARPAPPPRWKMAIILTAAVFVLSMIFRPLALATIGPYVGPVVIAAVVSAAIVYALTYAVMPYVTRKLGFWLSPKPRG